MSFYSDASLVLIPSGYKNQKVYSAVPTDGSGDLSFTRASDATRVASNGLIEKVRTNLILQSQTFENASWAKVGVGTGLAAVVTANAGAAPDGTTTADRIVFNTGAGTTSSDRSIFRQSVVITEGSNLSFYIKSNTGSSQSIGFHNGAQVDIFTATTSWQRFSVNMSSAVTFVGLENRGDNATAGTCDVLVWGAQLQNGDIATDYIATTTAAVSVGPVSGLPRLDYLGSTCPRLLLEPQRSSLMLYSEQMNNAVWTKRNSTISANAAISPDGYTNADKIQEDTSNDRHDIYQDFSATSGTTYTNSIFLKQGERRYAFISFGSGLIDPNNSFFDLQDGVVLATPAGVTSTITNYGNGWYRCTITATASGSGTAYLVTGASLNGTSILYQGVSGSGIFTYGAQLEAGAYATSYIPTLGASVTRVGEECQTTSLQSASLIGATAGTFFVEANKTDDAIWFNQRIFLTSTTQRAFLMDTIAGQIRLRTWDAASAGATITTSGLVNGLVKYLIKWDGTNVKVFANGVLVGSSAQPSYAYTTYSTFEGASFSNNEINQVLFFPTALSDTQCIELTA